MGRALATRAALISSYRALGVIGILVRWLAVAERDTEVSEVEQRCFGVGKSLPDGAQRELDDCACPSALGQTPRNTQELHRFLSPAWTINGRIFSLNCLIPASKLTQWSAAPVTPILESACILSTICSGVPTRG